MLRQVKPFNLKPWYACWLIRVLNLTRELTMTRLGWRKDSVWLKCWLISIHQMVVWHKYAREHTYCWNHIMVPCGSMTRLKMLLSKDRPKLTLPVVNPYIKRGKLPSYLPSFFLTWGKMKNSFRMSKLKFQHVLKIPEMYHTSASLPLEVLHHKSWSRISCKKKKFWSSFCIISNRSITSYKYHVLTFKGIQSVKI